MTFKVIDTKTGKEPTERVISNIARKGGLMEMDIDGFYVDEDGQIILVDDCGRCTWIDGKRFKAIPSAEPKTVLYSGDGYADGYMVYDMAECPNCGYEYDYGDKDWGLPFCPSCGQALNWERSDKE